MNRKPTPVQEIKLEILTQAGIRLLVKREDLNHAEVSGNKWWKLKYNLEEAQKQNKHTILTFGGAFSNHIYATASACAKYNLKSIGLIRGEETFPLNSTLSFAKNKGMELHYISREKYRQKDNPDFQSEMQLKYGDCYVIPEGGTNELAVKGCAEFAEQELSEIPHDYLMLPVGTGGTMAGVICGYCGQREIIGVSVLKNGDFLNDAITNLVKNFSGKLYGNWRLLTSYHHGGYAKMTKELLGFVNSIRKEHDLPLDTVYMGKLMWAIMRETERGKFRRGSTVLALHTGGLQGGIGH